MNVDYWDSLDSKTKFEQPRELFRSEKYFIPSVFKSGDSVLDVGCGCGALYHGVKDDFQDIVYTGVDIAKNMTDRARVLAPNLEFIHGDFLVDGLFEKDTQFDVVFATGVYQHEFRTKDLLRRMLDHTKAGGYLLFDVKLLHTHETLCDIQVSYVGKDTRVHYIAFHLSDFLNIVLANEDVAAMEIYGYYSGLHKNVHIPETVKESVCSAHVLLQRGTQDKEKPFSISMNLPLEFLKKFGARNCVI